MKRTAPVRFPVAVCWKSRCGRAVRRRPLLFCLLQVSSFSVQRKALTPDDKGATPPGAGESDEGRADDHERPAGSSRLRARLPGDGALEHADRKRGAEGSPEGEVAQKRAALAAGSDAGSPGCHMPELTHHLLPRPSQPVMRCCPDSLQRNILGHGLPRTCGSSTLMHNGSILSMHCSGS